MCEGVLKSKHGYPRGAGLQAHPPKIHIADFLESLLFEINGGGIMLFFKSFGSGKKKATSPGQSFRPLLEAFESRDLPSAGGFFAAHHFAMADLAGTTAASSGSTAASSGTQIADPVRAPPRPETLTGTTGSGTATFTSDTTDSTNSLMSRSPA